MILDVIRASASSSQFWVCLLVVLLVLGILELVIWEDLTEEMTSDFDLQVD